jgi:hypothetical protein
LRIAHAPLPGQSQGCDRRKNQNNQVIEKMTYIEKQKFQLAMLHLPDPFYGSSASGAGTKLYLGQYQPGVGISRQFAT